MTARSRDQAVGSGAPERSAAILDQLYAVLVDRREQRPEGSYVVQLLEGGWPAIAAKIVEEAGEVAVAGAEADDAAVVHEVADLLFHVFVGLAARDLAPEAVFEELARRFGIGGLVEKAARGAGGEAER